MSSTHALAKGYISAACNVNVNRESFLYATRFVCISSMDDVLAVRVHDARCWANTTSFPCVGHRFSVSFARRHAARHPCTITNDSNIVSSQLTFAGVGIENYSHRIQFSVSKQYRNINGSREFVYARAAIHSEVTIFRFRKHNSSTLFGQQE